MCIPPSHWPFTAIQRCVLQYSSNQYIAILWCSPSEPSPLTSHNRTVYFYFLSQEGSSKWNLSETTRRPEPYLTTLGQAVKLRATWGVTPEPCHQLFLCSNLLGCYGQAPTWPSGLLQIDQLPSLWTKAALYLWPKSYCWQAPPQLY